MRLIHFDGELNGNGNGNGNGEDAALHFVLEDLLYRVRGRCPAVCAGPSPHIPGNRSLPEAQSLESTGSRTTARSLSSSQVARWLRPLTPAARAPGRQTPYKAGRQRSEDNRSSRELTGTGHSAEPNHKWAIGTTNTSSTSSHPHLINRLWCRRQHCPPLSSGRSTT